MAHKRKVLDTQDKERQMFDCKKQDCLVNESCLTGNIEFKETVTTENQIKFYIGSVGLWFKNRHINISTVSNMKNTAMRHFYHSIFGNYKTTKLTFKFFGNY